MIRYIILLGGIGLLLLFQNCGKPEVRSPLLNQDINIDNFSSLQQASSNIPPTPNLFPSNSDACTIAASKRPTSSSLFTKLDIRNYGAIGDGKSHKIRALRSTGPLNPNLQNSLNSVVNAMSGLSRSQLIKTLDAEADWVAIQAALLDAKNIGDGWVQIPDSAGDYIIDRSLAISSNTILEWTGKSYIKLTEPTERGVGAALTNLFPYDSDSGFLYNDQSCFIRIISPKIDVGNIPGENGIGFANGAENIIVIGGEIRNSRFGTDQDVLAFLKINPSIDCSSTELFTKRCPNKQGGKAVQAEAGVKDILIKSVLVSSSTVGFSASAGHKAISADGLTVNIFRPNGVRNIAWNIKLEGVKTQFVDIPVLFSNIYVAEGGSKFLVEASQATYFIIDGLSSYESGWMSTPNIGSAAAIVGSFGAFNLTIQNVWVHNSNRKIGTFFRGFAHNTSISETQMNTNSSNIFTFDGALLGAYYPNYSSSDWSINSCYHNKTTDFAFGGDRLSSFDANIYLTNVNYAVASSSFQKLLDQYSYNSGFTRGVLKKYFFLRIP